MTVADFIAKLGGGQSASIMVIGDSTSYGTNDASWATKRGWSGRLCIQLAQTYGYTVHVYDWIPIYDVDSSSNSNWASATPTVLYAAAGLSPPILSLYNGGFPGATMASYILYAGSMLPSITSPDLLFLWDGFNENNISTFTNNYSTFIGMAQAKYPSATILACTENYTSAPYQLFGSGNQVAGPLFTDVFGALVTKFLPGETLPLSPAIQASTTVGGVWVLDSQQAPLVFSDLTGGSGIHPDAAGYAKIANWVLSALVSAPAPGRLTPGGATITTGTGTPTGIPQGRGGLSLRANWRVGDEFTAQDENNVMATLNVLITTITALGHSLPTLAAAWDVGSVWTSGDAAAVVAVINTLNAAVAGLGGPILADVPAVGAAWGAENENIAEAAINQLYAAVTALSGGG